MGVAITVVSSRGQIVVPAELRQDLGLEEGSKLLVYTKDKTLIAKKISEPVMLKTFAEIVEPVRARVKRAGLKEADVASAILGYRGEKR
ncbi:MAG: AbrB/MazE/SpoVT family DNA-binding domain-containing protein [Candidatus Diapherotrites archaeon]|nr:AbrB/MazE/SpoVT family DNA-binding domain-containing protein [Candidatus Diapherotrites archaeon]